MRRAALLCLLCSTSPFAAPPAPDAQEVHRSLTAARHLYESLDFERALEQLGRAKGLSRSASDDSEIALYEGIVLAELDRAEDSNAAFRTGLLLNPTAALPLKVAPKVQQAFEAVRARVQKTLARDRPAPSSAAPSSAAPSSAAPSSAGPSSSSAPAATATAPAARASRAWAWAPAIGGAVIAGAGAYLIFDANQINATLANPASRYTLSDATAMVSQGKTEQTLGVAGIALGAAAVVFAGGVWLWPSSDRAVAALPWVGPGGVGLAVGGGF